jgi:hypothetical protein
MYSIHAYHWWVSMVQISFFEQETTLCCFQLGVKNFDKGRVIFFDNANFCAKSYPHELTKTLKPIVFQHFMRHFFFDFFTSERHRLS